MGNRWVGGAAIFVVALGSACTVQTGHFPASRPLLAFPTRATLDQIAASAPAGPWSVPDELVDLPQWELDADPPAYVGREVVPPPFPDAPAITTPSVVYSRAATCAAHETARVVAHHSARPSPRLALALQARCGLAAAHVVTFGQRATGPVPDRDLLAPLAPAVQAASAAGTSRGRPVSIGLGIAHAPNGSAAVAVIAEHTVELEPFSPVPVDDAVIIRGRVLGPPAVVGGLVTTGAHRVTRCRSSSTRPSREVSMRCPIAAGDPTAWLQVTHAAPGRLLAGSAATILVAREPTRAIVVSGGARASTAAGPDVAADRTLLDLVNAVRREARLPALSSSAAQSQEITRLVPAFHAASLANDTTTMDTIALGSIAGHGLTEGPIRDAGFLWEWLAPTRDVRDWLDYALMLPLSRRPLLDPFANVLAYGQVVGPDERGGIVGIAATYRIFSTRDTEIDRLRVAGRLRRERRARGFRTRLFSGVGALDDAADAIREGRLVPAAAVHEAARGVSSAFGGSVRVHSIELTDLDGEIPFPTELLASAPLDAAVQITHHRPPGAAWGQHVILVAELR